MADSRTRSFYALQDVGIFTDWSDLERQLPGLEKPVFKAFRTLSAAEAFMAGWDDASSSSPFGYAGPSTLPPTPVSKLGRAPNGEREESREERKRRRKNFTAPSSVVRAAATAGSGAGGPGDLSPLAFGQPFASASTSSLVTPPPSSSVSQAGPSSSFSGGRPPLRNTQSMPVMSDLTPPSASLLAPPGAAGSPSVGGRRRSPLIQSVVEEEEDEGEDPDLLSPPPSSESEGNSFEAARSRAGSLSGLSSGADGVASSRAPSRRKSAFGLGLGGVFSSSTPKPLLSPPSSPDRRKGSFSSTTTAGSAGGSGAQAGEEATPKSGSLFSLRRKSSTPSAAGRDDASSIRSSALSVTSVPDRASGGAGSRPRIASMWDDPKLHAPPVKKPSPPSPPTATVPLRGVMYQPSFSPRALEPPVRPTPASRSESVDSLLSASGTPSGRSNSSSLPPAQDPLSPFASSQAPVFSRRESAGSAVVLPLLKASAAGSSASSLRRQSSAQSLMLNPHGSAFGSATSLTSFSVLEPPPKVLGRTFSYSSSRSGSPAPTPLGGSPSASVDSFSDALTHLSASTPRTSPDAVDERRRESMFEHVVLPPTPDARSARNGPEEQARPQAAAGASSGKGAKADGGGGSGGWKKALRKIRSVFA